MKIKKTVSAGHAQRLHSRLVIREFKHREDGHAFMNKQDNNDWSEYGGELKAGKYAFAGGSWHNVKSLDASVLAHI